MDADASDLTWRVEPTEGGGCRLTVTSTLVRGSTSEQEFASGIVTIASGLKTWLETGAAMVA